MVQFCDEVAQEGNKKEQPEDCSLALILKRLREESIPLE
jgi:hypothetical protein